MGKVKDYTKGPLQSLDFYGAELVYPPGFGGGLSPGEFEPEFVGYLREHLMPQMTFLDAGAYFGSYVCLAAPLVERVIAVEPHPDIRKVLLETIQRNGFDNVVVFARPLFSGAVRGQMGRRSNFQAVPDGPLESATLDSMEITPDVIKMDVEGAEYDALIGGRQTIEKCRPTILVEIHTKKIQRFGHTAKQVRQLLVDWGYRLADLGKRNENQFVVAEHGDS